MASSSRASDGRPWWQAPLQGGASRCLRRDHQLDRSTCDEDAECSFDTWHGVCLPQDIVRKRALWGTRWITGASNAEMAAIEAAAAVLVKEWKKYKCWLSTTPLHCQVRRGCKYSIMSNQCLPQAMATGQGWLRKSTAVKRYLAEHKAEAEANNTQMLSRTDMGFRGAIVGLLGWGVLSTILPKAVYAEIMHFVTIMPLTGVQVGLAAIGKFATYTSLLLSTVLNNLAAVGHLLTGSARFILSSLGSITKAAVATSSVAAAIVAGLGVMFAAGTVPTATSLLVWLQKARGKLSEAAQTDLNAAQAALIEASRQLQEVMETRDTVTPDEYRIALHDAEHQMHVARVKVGRAKIAAIGGVTWCILTVAVCASFGLLSVSLGVGGILATAQFLASATMVLWDASGISKMVTVADFIRIVLQPYTWQRLGKTFSRIFKSRLKGRMTPEKEAALRRARAQMQASEQEAEEGEGGSE